MSTHTPGPWAWRHGYLIQTNEDGIIPVNSKIVLFEQSKNERDEIKRADLKLIASAPDLLLMLEQIVSCLNHPVKDILPVFHRAEALIKAINGDT